MGEAPTSGPGQQVHHTSEYCAKQSLAAGEPIAGTATAGVEHWLLIEVRGRWERNIQQTPLPASLRDRLDNLSPDLNLRPQMVRRWNADELPLEAILVRSGPSARTWRFRGATLDELAAIDYERVLREDRDEGEADPPHALYAVCTHGRRDRCCAMWGVAFCKALIDNEPDAEVWQCSHLGGHRFAATAVYLPSGHMYGRLQPEDAPELIAAHRRQEIYDPRCYRGQTRYPPVVQVADSWLREHLLDYRFDGPEFLDAARPDDQTRHWTVRFRAADEATYRLLLEPRVGPVARRKSCDADQLTFPEYFYPVRYDAQMADVHASPTEDDEEMDQTLTI